MEIELLWKCNLYYKDPANSQIYDYPIWISEMDVYDLLSEVDRSILDHLTLVEIKPE